MCLLQSIDGLGRAEEATLLSGSSLLGVVYSARLLALGKLAVAQECSVAVPGAPLRVGWQVLESLHAEAVAVSFNDKACFVFIRDMMI